MKQSPLQYKKWFRNGITLVIFLTLISSGLILFNSTREQENLSLHHINFTILSFSFLILITSWIIEAIRIWLIATGLGEKISLKKIIQINLASTFMGNITPFNSGGIPTQVYLLCQAGIQPGKSSAIVTLRVILSTLLFTLIAPVLLFFFHKHFSFGMIQQITMVAIPLSALVSLLLIVFIIKPELAKKILSFLLGLFKSAKFQQFIEPFLNKFLNEMEIFHESIGQFRKGSYFFLVIIATFAYWFSFFTIAPCLISAFGVKIQGIFLKSIILQFIILFVIAYLPVPGGSGVMELMFFSLFSFVPLQIRSIFTLVWRFLSYYLITFIGGIIFIKIINKQPPQLTVSE